MEAAAPSSDDQAAEPVREKEPAAASEVSPTAPLAASTSKRAGKAASAQLPADVDSGGGGGGELPKWRLVRLKKKRQCDAREGTEALETLGGTWEVHLRVPPMCMYCTEGTGSACSLACQACKHFFVH